MAKTWRDSLLLFALGAWPAWVVDVPPLQDLPNHLATAVVLAHPAAYPELASNGLLKTNAAPFLFLEDCAARYRAAWAEFWADAVPRFDHVVMYHPSDDVRAANPPELRVAYDRDGVLVLARRATE